MNNKINLNIIFLLTLLTLNKYGLDLQVVTMTTQINNNKIQIH